MHHCPCTARVRAKDLCHAYLQHDGRHGRRTHRAYDVPSTVDTEAGLIEVQQRTRRLLEESHEGVLVFTDILGATPANIAHRLLDDPRICVISGANLPAIIAALNALPTPPSLKMTLAEAAARAGLSSQSGRSDNALK